MAAERKLYLGRRLRRLRRELGLNQSAMAGEIGVSPSYLNHLERNQRPVTAQVLLRLAETFDIDLKSFAAEGGEGTGAAQLAEIVADPMFGGAGRAALRAGRGRGQRAGFRRRGLPALRGPGRAAPPARRRGGRRRRSRRKAGCATISRPSATISPIWRRRPRPRPARLADPLGIDEPLRRRLKEGFGIEARIMPPETLDGASQHYDLHRKRLMLSALLRPESRTFGLAYQLALIEFRPLLEKMVAAAAPPDAPTRRLLHMSLANYAAGAIMMPYAPFLEAAERHRYDVDRLCALFGASVEQVAHRLTTLNRNNARGIPFFMLRVDAAGNISKRFAGEAFPFSRFGGTCPRWNLHSAFQTPGRVVTQIVETPDGQRFFTIGRTAPRSVRLDPREDSQLAIGLGCDVKHAARIAYADGLDLAQPQVTPIGPACAICPRVRCPQRAAAPAGRTLTVDETRKTISPFPFLGG